jgi:hypothetical protein
MTEITCQWCNSSDMELRKAYVTVFNAQLDVPHALYVCAACKGCSLLAQWGNRHYHYRTIERRRLFRSSLYIIIYPISCTWCGETEQVEPEDINATIANPASRRHRYDVYRCNACEQYTAVSYLGDVETYPAVQDTNHPNLYHVRVEDE